MRKAAKLLEHFDTSIFLGTSVLLLLLLHSFLRIFAPCHLKKNACAMRAVAS